MGRLAKVVLDLQRKLWEEIHTFKFTDEFSDRMRFSKWMSRIPDHVNCSCSSHFAAILSDLPADFSSEDAFFVRSWEWHNRVNERLGKPKISLEEARNLWQDKQI